jgi:LysM repeat protein
MQCNPGYQYGQNYSVAISYQGKIVVAAVGEAGPWNIDDNFWSKTNDPQPRRMFTDLPLGVPAAQAAYFNGYNGGLDQFGRVVTSPVAIDISYAVAKDLGLPSGNNKVTVSFLWTEGWDDPGVQGIDETQVPVMEVTPVITSTSNPDGSVVHEVQQGQTLSGIAEVYGIPLGELLALNGLDMGSILLPGDRVIVKSSQPTAIAGGATEDVIVITRPTLTPTPSSTPIVQASPPPGIETAALPAGSTPGASAPPSIDPALMIIAGIGIAGIGLLLWGLLVNRRNQ